MTEQTIAIYCFIDDFLHAIGRKDDAHCKVSDTELLTTALLSARFFHGNLHSACCYPDRLLPVAVCDNIRISFCHLLRSGLPGQVRE